MFRPHESIPAGHSPAAVAAVVIAVALASCSLTDDDSGPPPPLTRDVSGVTTTTTVIAAQSTTGSTRLPTPAGPRRCRPPPLTYSIAWEQVDDRTEVGTITVPVDYDDPQGATLDLRRGAAPGRPRRPHRRARHQQRGPGRGGECDGPERRELVPARADRPVRHRVVGSPRHRRVRRVGRLHRRLRVRPVLLRAGPHSRRRCRAAGEHRRGPRRSPNGASIGSTISRRSARTTPLAISMPSVRRWTNHRSRTSASATAANSVVCGRRCSRRPSGRRCSTARPTRTPTRSSGPRTSGSVSRTPSTRSSPDAARTATARSTTTATRRVRSTP